MGTAYHNDCRAVHVSSLLLRLLNNVLAIVLNVSGDRGLGGLFMKQIGMVLGYFPHF